VPSKFRSAPNYPASQKNRKQFSVRPEAIEAPDKPFILCVLINSDYRASECCVSRTPHESLQRRKKRGAKTYNSKCDGRANKKSAESLGLAACGENAMQKVQVMQPAAQYEYIRALAYIMCMVCGARSQRRSRVFNAAAHPIICSPIYFPKLQAQLLRYPPAAG